MEVVCWKGTDGPMTVDADGAMKGQTRTSRLVAEALVEGHGPTRIVDRAQEVGLPEGLTSAVVAACCGQEWTRHACDGSAHLPSASGDSGCFG